MERKEVNTRVPLKQMLEEATTIAVWEKVKPENVKFRTFSLVKGKVISASGLVTVNDTKIVCWWNYQGICLDIRTLTVVEEGCL